MNKENFKLFKSILEKSESKIWENASKEWYDYNLVVDSSRSESCVCGQPNLKNQFTIKNKINGNEIFPIGSECIKFFQDEEMTDSIQVRLEVQELVNHVKQGKFLEYNSKLFTRKVLKYLYDDGAFKSQSKYFTENAYFDIFWKARFSHATASSKQINTAKHILMTSIIPYCKNFQD